MVYNLLLQDHIILKSTWDTSQFKFCMCLQLMAVFAISFSPVPAYNTCYCIHNSVWVLLIRMRSLCLMVHSITNIYIVRYLSLWVCSLLITSMLCEYLQVYFSLLFGFILWQRYIVCAESYTSFKTYIILKYQNLVSYIYYKT